jgi:hypothetical protein
VQYSTSPQKRSKEGGRALSVEAPLGMSMEMLTFGTNLGGYRTYNRAADTRRPSFLA